MYLEYQIVLGQKLFTSIGCAFEKTRGLIFFSPVTYFFLFSDIFSKKGQQ